MNRIFFAAAVTAALFATQALAQDATAPQAAPAAPAVAAAAPAAPPKAPETGKIVFFRPSRLTGAIYTYHIVETAEDGKKSKESPELGDLHNGGAFATEVPAGIHNFNISGPMAVNKAEDRLRMEVEPGETYYVEQTVRMGLVTGGFRLVPSDEARFKESKAKLSQTAAK